MTATSTTSAPATTAAVGPAGRTGRSPALTLRSITKVLGGRRVVDSLDLEVAGGELVCILGPSGCGKTTTLRMVAGFVRPDGGQILIDGQDVTTLEPQRRPTAMVFQNYALWPHMNVLRNVTFGLRARGLARKEADQRGREALALVGLDSSGPRLPGGLSGGEQQRVALARALVLEPTLLLMDEPLSNLDAQLRLRVREELVELQQRTGITMLFVTHDQDEALSIADRVAVMSAGRFDQVDTPGHVYRDPATSFVAGFVGRVNVLGGAVAGGHLSLRGAAPSAPILAATGRDGRPLADGEVDVSVRPEEVLLGADPGRSGAPAPIVEGTVVRRLPRGHFDEVLLDTPLGTLRAYVGAGTEPADAVPVAFGRTLLYRDGRLVGTARDGRLVGTATTPEQASSEARP
ncbi:MAG TPA: ABC transporter ATP-binding protein [Acidimicrobiales bacterium]|nr:ABC transporter ATP-binding protein [Acidimicrobiales bacterium]